MNSIIRIQELINSLDSPDKNNAGDIFLNAISNEFITFNGTIKIPRLPVKELDYDLAVDIIKDLIKYLPDFFYDHSILEKRKPPSEQHSLHFVQLISGKHIYFIHIFKIHLKFSGDTSNIIEQGNSDYYPSYTTNRIYYKSKLIPENSILRHGKNIIDFTPIRLKDSASIESDRNFFTSTVFDEMDTKSITIELNKLIDSDLFKISPKLYPYISFDYFTAAFNILYPDQEEIRKGLDIFEPLFIYIYSNYLSYSKIITEKDIIEKFGNELDLKNNKVFLKDQFLDKLKSYFGRYSLYRDDDMILKGWRKFKRE